MSATSRRALAALLALGLSMACQRSEPVQPPPAAPSERSEAALEATPPGAVRQTAILAGGCFWGMEELLRALPGVVDTTVGYTGGTADKPGYDQVKTGRSGHAESVQLTFDPSRISYQQIVEYFFTIHDPTTENRQGNDVGTQYRSALFVQNAEQRRVAEAVIARVEASGAWKQPITTQVVEATAFHPAESYHQDYLKKNPGGYTCHFERDISFD